jgi:hypothetical protein
VELQQFLQLAQAEQLIGADAVPGAKPDHEQATSSR